MHAVPRATTATGQRTEDDGVPAAAQELEEQKGRGRIVHAPFR